ncbi:MAG: glycosyltransferase family 2 protein [Firmicutes bacterium]|nr:glycosyltransferase family 2 protein [Bacillota bacterium]
MKTSIIIVNYNAQPYLERCLAQIANNTDRPHEVIVVDNHSTDQSVPFLLKGKQQGLRVIFNPENRGFAAACNQGIKAATGHFLVTMNPDVFVPPQWLSRLIWHLTANPRCLLVGPKGRGIGGRQRAGLLNYSRKLEAADRKFARLYHRQSEPTKFLIGCLVLFNRRLIEKIGYFDENLPLGADDFDLSLRIRQHGYELRVAKDLLIDHTVHASFHRSDPAENERLADASWAHFHRKWQQELQKYGWERLFEDDLPVFPHETALFTPLRPANTVQ